MSFTFRRRWDGGGDDGENFTSPTLSWMATSSTIVSKNKRVSLHFGLHHEFNDQQLCCVHVQVFWYLCGSHEFVVARHKLKSNGTIFHWTLFLVPESLYT